MAPLSQEVARLEQACKELTALAVEQLRGRFGNGIALYRGKNESVVYLGGDDEDEVSRVPLGRDLAYALLYEVRGISVAGGGR